MTSFGGVFGRFDRRGEAGKGFARFEGFTMFGCEAVFMNGFDVDFGAVADVFVEAIVWVFSGKINHIVVTGDLGDDGGSRDFTDFRVAFDTGGGVFF